MKRIVLLLFVMFLFIGAYSQSSHNTVATSLTDNGFENVQVAEIDDIIYIGVEDNDYRNSYMAVAKAMKVILSSVGKMEKPKGFEVVFFENNLPQLHIGVSKELVEEFSKQESSFADVVKHAVIDYDTDMPWNKLQKTKVEMFDKSAWKVDLVVYPQVSLGNHHIEESWYDYSFALAPAVQMQLWKGASFTAQVVLPIAQNIGGESKFVRPGVIALSQGFDFGKGFKSMLSVGNFTTNRMGGVIDFSWRSKNGRLTLSANGGVTVQSLMTDSVGWRISDKKRVTGSLAASYYVAPLQTMLKLSCNKHIYGDNSLRADLQRHFQNHTIGFYAMYVEKDVNCGFNFSCSLFPRHSKHNKGFRVRAAKSWDMEYSMKSFYRIKNVNVNGQIIQNYDYNIGKSFYTSPESRSGANFMQPDYIRYFVAKYGDRVE